MSIKEVKHLVSKNLLLLAGTLCVGLGILGMFFPILPTTPFLLLAAYFYVRSSRRFYQWLITNRWFGAYIRNYRAGLGIPLVQKVLTLVLLWLSIGYAAGFVIEPWWGKLILVAIAAGVTIHLLKIKTYKTPAALPGNANPPDDHGTAASTFREHNQGDGERA